MGNQLRPHDAAVWRTVWINDLIDRGSFHTAEKVPTAFAPQLGENERVVGAGPFTQFAFVAAGDGSYLHQSGGGGMLFTSHPGVLAAGAGLTLAGAAWRGWGNARRRKEAEQLAQEQWRQVGSGSLYVSQHGFYLHTQRGLLPWWWSSISAAQLVGPGQFLMSGDSQHGPVQWILQSDWGELAFTLWARARHPDHPQFQNGAWIPPGWVERARASAYGLPRLSHSRWRHVLPPSD